MNDNDNDDFEELQNKLVTYLTRKGISKAGDKALEIMNNSVTKDRARRLLEGDIRVEKTNFTDEFLKFSNRLKSESGGQENWKSAMESLNRMLNFTDGDNKTDFLGRKRSTSHSNEVVAKRVNTGKSSEGREYSDGNNGDKSAESLCNTFWQQFEAFDTVNSVNIHDILVIRKQNRGNCYLHGAFTLEHYLVAIATEGQNRYMVDIGLYLASDLSGKKVLDFLENRKKGGSSSEELMKLCDLKLQDLTQIILPNPEVKSPLSSFQETCEFIYIHVAQKPFLVCNFHVYSKFLSKDKVSYERNDIDERFEGTHSMLLIGARKDSSNKYYFLLQNWWRSKFFVEVSAEYLYLCNPTLNYVTKVVTRKNDLIGYIASYAETCLDDFSDELLDTREKIGMI